MSAKHAIFDNAGYECPRLYTREECPEIEYPKYMSKMTIPGKYDPRGRYQGYIHKSKRAIRITSEICPWTICSYRLSAMDVNAFANIFHVSCSYDRENALIGNVYT